MSLGTTMALRTLLANNGALSLSLSRYSPFHCSRSRFTYLSIATCLQ